MIIPLILLTIGGVVLSVVVGTVWYSQSTPMGKLHMRYLGFDKLSPEEQKRKMEEAKLKMAKMYAAQMALSLLTSFAVVFIVMMSITNGVSLSLSLGFVVFNWLCFMVPIIGQGMIWGNVDRQIVWKKFFADISYSLVTVLLIALMTSLFV